MDDSESEYDSDAQRQCFLDTEFEYILPMGAYKTLFPHLADPNRLRALDDHSAEVEDPLDIATNHFAGLCFQAFADNTSIICPTCKEDANCLFCKFTIAYQGKCRACMKLVKKDEEFDTEFEKICTGIDVTSPFETDPSEFTHCDQMAGYHTCCKACTSAYCAKHFNQSVAIILTLIQTRMVDPIMALGCPETLINQLSDPIPEENVEMFSLITHHNFLDGVVQRDEFAVETFEHMHYFKKNLIKALTTQSNFLEDFF